MKEYALVTGASSGIGLEFAKILAKKGNNLIIVARNKKKLEYLKKEIENENQVEVKVIEKDLAKSGAATNLYKEIQTLESVHVNVLINNAGFGDSGEFVEEDFTKITNMINLNVLSLTQLTRLFIEDMKKANGGKILNVASTASFLLGPYMNVYYATKAYVLSFSESLRYELKGTGISVTTLCPGPTHSEFAKTAGVEDKDSFSGKLSTSKEVAEYGYKSMMKNKGVAIHGFWNNLVAFVSRILPRRTLLRLVARNQK